MPYVLCCEWGDAMTKEQFLQEYCKDFSLVELLYDFDSGGLSNKLKRAGLSELAAKIDRIPNNAYAAQEIFKVFGLDPHLSETEIRQKFSPDQPL